MNYLEKLKLMSKSVSNQSLFEQFMSFEFNGEKLSNNDVDLLEKQFRYITMNTPDVNYYSEIFKKILLDQLVIKFNGEAFKKKVDKFKSRLPKDLFEGKFKISDPQLLFSRLFIITNILMPMILIESGIGWSNKRNGLTKKKYITNKVKFVTDFQKYSELYIRKIKRLGLLEYLLEFDRLKESREIENLKREGCISRSQFAFMIFEFACLNDKYMKSAGKSLCMSLLKEHSKGKVTKKALHILCHIVFELLENDSKSGSKKAKQISTYYKQTSIIINSFAPKKYDGKACYTTSKRVVEVALTGK